MKPLVWVGDTKKQLSAFPAPVKRTMGNALMVAQCGGKHSDTKPLTGHKAFKGSKILEVVTNFDGDTYRSVYTVRFEHVVYVLHSFQKKSKKDISTPQQEIELIKKRLKDAETRYNCWTSGRSDEP